MPNLHEGKEPEKWEMDGWKRVTQQMTFQEGNEKYIKKGFTGADGPETSSTSYFSYFFSTFIFLSRFLPFIFQNRNTKKSIFAPPIIV
jgi:hypothetical protein